MTMFQTGGLTLAQVNLIHAALDVAREEAMINGEMQRTDDLIHLTGLFADNGANLIALDPETNADVSDQAHAEANGDPNNTGEEPADMGNGKISAE